MMGLRATSLRGNRQGRATALPFNSNSAPVVG